MEKISNVTHIGNVKSRRLELCCFNPSCEIASIFALPSQRFCESVCLEDGGGRGGGGDHRSAARWRLTFNCASNGILNHQIQLDKKYGFCCFASSSLHPGVEVHRGFRLLVSDWLSNLLRNTWAGQTKVSHRFCPRNIGSSLRSRLHQELWLYVL